jgi:hypothetical protein
MVALAMRILPAYFLTQESVLLNPPLNPNQLSPVIVSVDNSAVYWQVVR